MYVKPNSRSDILETGGFIFAYLVPILIGAGTAVLGALAAETAWPHQCLEFLPTAAVLGAAGGGVGSWHAGSLFGRGAGHTRRWRLTGAVLGGFISGFAFFAVIFMQCRLLASG